MYVLLDFSPHVSVHTNCEHCVCSKVIFFPFNARMKIVQHSHSFDKGHKPYKVNRVKDVVWHSIAKQLDRQDSEFLFGVSWSW